MSRTLILTGREWISGIPGVEGKKANTLCVVHFERSVPSAVTAGGVGIGIFTLPNGWRPASYTRIVGRSRSGVVGVDASNTDGIVRVYHIGSNVAKGEKVNGTLVYYTADPR